jgi:simple sugar transport system ATP-binding protein
LLNRKAYAEQVTALAHDYGLSIDVFAGTSDLSVGERQVVEIIKCLIRRPRVIILDDPTAVLPPDEVDALLALCRRATEGGRAVVLVTHKLAEIKRAADRVTVLRHGRAVARSTAPSDEIDRLVRAMIQRDLQSLDAVTSSSLGVETVDTPEPLNAQSEQTSREHAIRIDDLTLHDDNGANVLDSITLTVAKGEIVGLAGVEGNGQRELGGVIAGLSYPDRGSIVVAGRDITGASPAEIGASGVGIVPEDRHAEGCIIEMSLAENLYLNRLERFIRFGFIDRKALREQSRALMQQFDIRAAGPDAAFSSLSGGNQQKSILARELTRDNLVFLLAAQPTRGLDVGAIEAVYGYIRDACASGTGVLLISSELDELLSVSHRILVIYRGRIVGERPADPRHRETIGAMMSGHLT